MNEQHKTLQQKLDEVKHDPSLMRLHFRYWQGLDCGDSHWRESMTADKFIGQNTIQEYTRSSQQAVEEEKIAHQNPTIDVKQRWLMEKYRQRSGD